MQKRIYFAGSILGGREYLPAYQWIVARIQAQGYLVPSEHVAHADVLKEESAVSARAVFERDMDWMRSCNAMIAEVSTPSLGVGYEICSAIALGKPILCLHREGLIISKMITGNPAPNMNVVAYRDLDELGHHLDRFLVGLRD